MLKYSKVKKDFNTILLIVLFFDILLFLSHPLVSAQTEIVDQQNNSVSSAGNQIYINGHKQTFIPSLSQTTKIQVYLNNKIEGENLLIILRDENTNEVIQSKAKEMSENGEGWEIFSFTSLYLGQGNLYSIELQTSYYNSDTPIWMKSEVDTYLEGAHKAGSKTYDDDMVFVTWGYTQEGVDDTSIYELPTTGEGDLDEEDNESFENFTTRKNYWEVEVTNIDNDMMIPEIEFIKYNENVVVLEEGESINVYSDDTIEVLGSASSGMSIVIYIGQGAFITEADSNGGWTIQIDCEQVERGVFDAKIQAQEDGVGSRIQDAFSINRMEGKNPEGSKINIKDTILYTLFIGEYKIYTYSVIFFFIFFSALVFIIKNNKKKRLAIESKDIKKEKEVKKEKEKRDNKKDEQKIEVQEEKETREKEGQKVDEKTERQKAVVDVINEQLRNFGKPIDYGDAYNHSEEIEEKESKEDKELEKFKKDIEEIKNMNNKKKED